MFFYISFLRPPPWHAATFGTISITPQIANDLRTEPFDGVQDIFYSWSQCSGSNKTITKLIKLTTWRPSNAYKEIPVPLPPGLRDGQSWRLLLSARAQGGLGSIIDLQDQALGRVPFPVMSMPVLFGAKSGKGSGKQEQIERVYKLRDSQLDATFVSLTITEQTSFDLDKKIWDSGIGLSSWLVGLEQGSTSDVGSTTRLKDALFSGEPRNILELGAGTGIVALTLAAIRAGAAGSSSESGNDHIITTDLGSAMPLLQHNIKSNSHLFPNAPPQAEVLDWDDEMLPEEVQLLDGGLDAVVMADVTYNTASFPSLVRILSLLTRLEGRPPIVLLGYKERDPAERTLWELTESIGIHFEKVGERGGAQGAPIEIWLGEIKVS